MRVLIAVTHLLGTGHLSRALTLGRAFVRAGHTVTVASGGQPAPQLGADGVDMVQLPPLRSDGVNFTRLLTPSGALADPAYHHARQGALLDALAHSPPDILITELFPFGRRVLRAEFLALLEAARAQPRPPVVLSSIRDILAPPSTPEKARRADEITQRFYDAVLVHSDPAITRLEASWPVSPDLAARLRYTGYVAPPAAAPCATGAGEVLVSAGGGAVGDALFATALDAARLRPGLRWRLLVGGDTMRLDRLRVQAAGAPNIRIDPARPEFRAMLHRARASVSMCGYNTALDLLQAGTPAVLVPFDAGNEVEQGLRADSLSRHPGIACLRSAELGPERLAVALDRVMQAPQRLPASECMDGAAHSVRIASRLAEARP